MNPLISIIVPTYNRRWLLPRALSSLLNQSYQDIEVIVVNDCGENVQDVIDQYDDKRIRYFQNEKNLGLAGTRNVALKNCRGKFISLLDDDDIYLKYAIEFRVYMLNKLNADIVYTRSLLDKWQKTSSGYTSIGKSLYWDSKFSRDLLLVQNIAPCCNVMFSKSSWENTNYWFDESLTTTEDHDFWIALSRKHNFENLEIVDTECSQREDNSQMTGSRDFSKNWIKVFKKWRHTAQNLEWVTQSQNNILKRVGINPEDYNL